MGLYEREFGGATSLLIESGAVLAQLVEITPNTQVTPSSSMTPWIIQMAVGAAILGALIIVGVGSGYLRFAPKFFGREGAPKPPPGTRPPLLTRQVPRPAPAQAPSAAPARTATTVEERPAPPNEAAAPAPPAEEAAAPASSAEQAAAPAPEAPAPTPSAEQAPAPAAEQAPSATAPAPAASHSADLDQETFDRVLQEQLDKGMDRRVAEGRARAAAVVAARKKAQSE